MGEIPKWVKFILFLIVFIVMTTLGIFNTFATNYRVDSIEAVQVRHLNVLCGMAIDLKWGKATEACKK